MDVSLLKNKLREVRDNMSQDHAIRLHRACSWLQACKDVDSTPDLSFITLWISFNACYSFEESSKCLTERQAFMKFVETIVSSDSDNRLYDLLWNNYSGFIRGLINNQYLFGPFWESQINHDDKWVSAFESSKQRANWALANNQVVPLLLLILDRLYILRNQLVHGGATYQSRINREQVKDGVRFLQELMPLFISILMEHDDLEWGRVAFPVVD